MRIFQKTNVASTTITIVVTERDKNKFKNIKVEATTINLNDLTTYQITNLIKALNDIILVHKPTN